MCAFCGSTSASHESPVARKPRSHFQRSPEVSRKPLAGIWTAFFSWYTSFGGPLSDEEVEHYLSLMESQGEERSPEALAAIRRFLEEVEQIIDERGKA